MGKLISRSAAAKLLGCTPQTVSNYAQSGLIDELQRQMDGRMGFYYDKEQLSALALKLTDIAVLEERIAEKKAAMELEERELEEARKKARQEILRAAGGKKTLSRFKDLVKGAYAYARKATPGIPSSGMEGKVIDGILNLEDYDTICRSAKASPYKVDAVISRVARRMIYATDMKTRLDEISRDVERLWEDNRSLQKALELQKALSDESAMRSPSALGDEVAELARRLYPLQTMSIASLGFSERAKNCLEGLGVKTLFELVGCREDKIRNYPGVGTKTFEEIRDYLNGLGLSFGMHALTRNGLGFDYVREKGFFRED